MALDHHGDEAAAGEVRDLHKQQRVVGIVAAHDTVVDDELFQQRGPHDGATV